MGLWKGGYRPHEHLSGQNVTNGLLCAFALAPSVFSAWYWFSVCDNSQTGWCSVGRGHPIGVVNVLFFLNISLGFWIVGLLQRSFWLIDPYWTLLPPLIGHFYQLHPRATSTVRSTVALVLVWVWAIRLTHSYFRREEWKVMR